MKKLRNRSTRHSDDENDPSKMFCCKQQPERDNVQASVAGYLVIGCNEPYTDYDSIFGGHLLDTLTCKTCGKVCGICFGERRCAHSQDLILVTDENRTISWHSPSVDWSGRAIESIPSSVLWFMFLCRRPPPKTIVNDENVMITPAIKPRRNPRFSRENNRKHWKSKRREMYWCTCSISSSLIDRLNSRVEKG